MAISKRKKKFFEVDIPLISKKAQLQAYEIKELDKRLITYDLTRILRGKSIMLQLIVDVQGEVAKAHPRKIHMLSYYLRRMMRKRTNYIEDSFSLNCKDAQMRIKPFLITRRKVSRKVRSALRNKAKEELISFAKDKSSEELFEEILKNRLQKTLSLKLKKIYPLSLCEIRALKIEKQEKIDKTPKDSKKEEETTKEQKE